MPLTVFGIISFHFQWSEVWDDAHARQGLFRRRRQSAKLLRRTSSICRENIFKCHYGFNYIKKGRQCRPGSLFPYYGCLGIVYTIGEALSISLWIYTVPWLCLWVVILNQAHVVLFFFLINHNGRFYKRSISPKSWNTVFVLLFPQSRILWPTNNCT